MDGEAYPKTKGEMRRWDKGTSGDGGAGNIDRMCRHV